jgi:leucyl aminopeptidase
VVAAVALRRAEELGARVLCWELPHKVDDSVAAALVEGTLLAAYRYTAFKSEPGDDRAPEALVVSAHHDVSAPVERGRAVGEAANRARDLGNAPPNAMQPTALAERARAIPGVQVDVMGRAEIEAAGMGAFASIAQGSDAEPQLITIRYEGADRGPVLGIVGKAVTFDSGGYSIKPAARMHEMKFDMGGGAAVLEATAAIAELGLPIRLVTVIGATENMVSARAVRPGDIVRAKSGITIEVNNTDAEGRLVLADCLTHAREQGAERLIDLATLTGGIVATFGPVHAGLMGNDDGWCDAVRAAGEATGERVWRLPLDPAYDELIKGRYADLINSSEGRKAQSITAAALLQKFAGDVPWAHLDIAGVADALGRPYAAKGASGWGVRLLVELAATMP